MYWAEAGRRLWLAPLVAVMGLLIFLRIPFGNVLPAVAVAFTGPGGMAWHLAGQWAGF